MYHKIRLNSTYCCAALQKNCTFFTKKTHFRLYKKQKTESQGSPSVRFFCFMLYRGWDAAFYQTPAAPPLRRCVLPYSCHAAAVAPRFAISLPRRGWDAVFCQTPATLRLRRCVLPYPCCTAAGALHFIRPLPRCRWDAAFCHISCRGWDAAFCQTSAALLSVMYLCRSLPPD